MGYKNVTQEYHGNQRLKESNLFTVLTSVGRQPVSKRARVTSKSEFEYFEPILPKWHTHQVYQVPDIKSMGEFITDIEAKPRSYLVYGLPNKELVPGDKILRRKVNFLDRKTKWLIIDFDNVLPASWTNQTPPTKTFNQLWSSLASIPGMDIDMPPTVWQLSNSWGDANKEVPKCHAFIQLDNPISVARLRSWADFCRTSCSIDIDKAIYQRTQPIYTARPSLIGSGRAHELNELKRVYTKAKGSKLISSELILNIPEARDAQIPIEREGDSELFEYILSRLEDEGLVRQARDGGKYDIICPLVNEHTGGENDTSTTIWSPTNGKGPSFHCQHTNTHSNGRNGWQWFLTELTNQGVLKQAEIHEISQSSAKADFSIDKHRSKWTIDDIQSNYIFVSSQSNVYSVHDKSILTTTSLEHMHQFVYESPEARQAGDKPKKGMQALMLSNMSHPGCKVVTSERFDPKTTKLLTSHKDIQYLNSFSGFRLRPHKGNTKLFHKHIDLLCPDSAEAEAFTDYLAHVIQRPWERPSWSPIHVSVTQGLGRGLLNQLMNEILAGYYASPSPSDMFESQFNGYLKNTLWIGIEETSVRTGKGVATKLKELITLDKADINIKNRPILSGYPVYARLFFMTNELDALPLEDSDRRNWVIGPSEPGYEKRGPKYYKIFARAMKNEEFQAAVMHDLMHRDLKNFDPHDIPFKTQLKDDMQKAARTPVEKALNRIIDCKHFPPFMDPARITKLMEEYLHHHHHSYQPIHIKNVLSRLPMWANGKQIRLGGPPVRLRILYNRTKYKKYNAAQIRGLKQKDVPMDWYND